MYGTLEGRCVNQRKKDTIFLLRYSYNTVNIISIGTETSDAERIPPSRNVFLRSLASEK